MATAPHSSVQKVIGIFCRKPPICSQVLFARQRVDHAAGAEEQQRLEEGVRHDVEHAGRIRADAEAEKHVAELRDRGVREDLLDVVLYQADGRRQDGGQRDR